MESILLASSGTLEGIQKMIKQYFFGSPIKLQEMIDGSYIVHVGSAISSHTRVMKKGKRFRFERIKKAVI